jgi:phosphonate transport system substrate-binding protein
MHKRTGWMNYLRVLTTSVCAILMFGPLTACKSNQTNGGNPKVLRYAFVPSEETMIDNSLQVKLMQKYLESRVHIPVEAIRVSGYAATIEAMHTNKVDIATFGPMGYIIASEKAGAEAMVAIGDKSGKLDTYTSVIIVPKESPIHSIDDLKAHAKDLVFTFTDPASTSGNLIPRAYLQSIGIDPERDFKKVVYSGTHPAAILTIKAGKVDAGAVEGRLFIPRLIEMGKLAPDDLRLLWRSDPIPTSPFTLRKSLPAPLKEQIQQAFLAIPTSDPALWTEMKRIYRRPEATFVPVSDSTYDGLRKFSGQIKNLNIVEK